MHRTSLVVTCLAVLAGCKAVPAHRDVHLMVNVLYGDPNSQHTDSRSRGLLAALPDVPKAGYTLRDEAEFRLQPQTTGRLQLPDGSWISIEPTNVNDDGQARLAITFDNVQLKTSAMLAVGTTLAIGGAPYGRGELLVAIRNL